MCTIFSPRRRSRYGVCYRWGRRWKPCRRSVPCVPTELECVHLAMIWDPLEICRANITTLVNGIGSLKGGQVLGVLSILPMEKSIITTTLKKKEQTLHCQILSHC